MLANRSEPIIHDQPLKLDTVPGLTEALDCLVNSPIPADLVRRFINRPEFDLNRYESHVLAHLRLAPVAFDDIPALIHPPRLDRIFRFIAVIFLAHHGRVNVWKERETIQITENEAHRQGQGVPRAAGRSSYRLARLGQSPRGFSTWPPVRTWWLGSAVVLAGRP